MRKSLLTTLSIIPFLWGCQANDQFGSSENHPYYSILESSLESTLDNLNFAIKNGYSDAEILNDSCQVYYEAIDALKANQIMPSADFKNNLDELKRVAC